MKNKQQGSALTQIGVVLIILGLLTGIALKALA